MKRVSFLLAALLMAGPVLGQQPASVRGTVSDAQTGERLPQANVILSGTALGTATDEEGRYELSEIPPGTYTLIVSYVGYRPHRQEITLSPGEERSLDTALEPEEVRAAELTVTAERAEAQTQELGVTQLTPEDIRELPAVLEPDVFRSLQLLPGIKAASDFSSGLYIRGGSPDQTLILLDQTTVYNPSHVFGFFSTFNPDAIDAVRVYKGGFPATYGGRLGSVVDLQSKTGSREETGGSFSMGLLASRVVAEGPFGKGSWMLALRRSTLEPLLAALNGAGVEDLPQSFHFYDFNGRVAFEASSRDRLALSVYAGQDQLDYPFLDAARFGLSYGNRTLSASWEHLFSDRLVSNLTVTGSRYFSRPIAEISSTEFEQSNGVWDYTLKGDLTWEAAEAHTLEAGFTAGRFSFGLENHFDGEETLTLRSRTDYVSAYAQDTFAPTPNWEVRGGLRTTYHTRGGHLRLAPRLSVERRLTDGVRLQAGYGRYTQYLSLISSGLASAFDIWLTTEENVPPSYGDQFVAGLKTRPFEDVQLDVEAYYRTMRELFIIDPRLPDAAGLDYEELFLFGDGYAYGLETYLRKSSGPASGFLSYTYGQTQRRFPAINADATGQPQYYPPKYDRRHDLTLVLGYDFAPRWRVTGVFTYGTGQAYTEPTAQYKLLDSPFGSSPVDVLQSDFNAARLPPYHRLDLGVRNAGRLFGWADYELQLQVINVYSRRNVWFYFFEAEQDNTVERNEVPQIPIPLPNVSLTLEF